MSQVAERYIEPTRCRCTELDAGGDCEWCLMQWQESLEEQSNERPHAG